MSLVCWYLCVAIYVILPVCDVTYVLFPVCCYLCYGTYLKVTVIIQCFISTYGHCVLIDSCGILFYILYYYCFHGIAVDTSW